jgi:hypothetical protein
MSNELFSIMSLTLNFAIGGFVVLTQYRQKKIETTVNKIRRFLARTTGFNVDKEKEADL